MSDKINDTVKIKTSKFGIGYSKGRPEFTFGKVLKIHGKIYDVLWEGGEENALMKTHGRHLIYQSNLGEVEGSEEEPRLFSKISNETILPILSEVGALTHSPDNEMGSWPRDFYEALLREDWRDWVQAVKNENDSWSMLEASSEVATLRSNGERGIYHTAWRALFNKKIREAQIQAVCFGKPPQRGGGFRGDLFQHSFR
jgi:hypothetical protein